MNCLRFTLVLVVCYAFYQIVLLERGPHLLDIKPFADLQTSRKEMSLHEILLKNSSDFTENERNQFYIYKEKEYSERRERVRSVCRSLGSNFERKIRKSSIIFDNLDSVAYCPIAKVASSTWSDHFINLCK